MSDHITTISDASFQADVLDSSIPVLIDFWAEWCGPCRALAPVLEEVAPGYKGRLKIVKIDVDANHETPAKYGVRGIPTLILFKNGEVAATQVGSLTKSQLSAFVDSHL